MLLTGEADVIAKDGDDDGDEQLSTEVPTQFLESNNKSDSKNRHNIIVNDDTATRDTPLVKESVESCLKKMESSRGESSSKVSKFPVRQLTNSGAAAFFFNSSSSVELRKKVPPSLSEIYKNTIRRKEFLECPIPLLTSNNIILSPYDRSTQRFVLLERRENVRRFSFPCLLKRQASCASLRSFPLSGSHPNHNRRISFPFTTTILENWLNTPNYSCLNTDALKPENIKFFTHLGGHTSMSIETTAQRDCQKDSNCYLLLKQPEQQQHEQQQHEQHINDAKLATANSTAKNTPSAATSQIHDDESSHYSSLLMRAFISRASSSSSASPSQSYAESVSRQPQHIKANNLDNQNEQPLLEIATTTPPPTTSELSEILEELLDAALNSSITRVDSDFHISQTPATCSDVRDSSSQEVPLLDGVSGGFKTLQCQARKELFASELLLPRLCALERNEPDCPEVDVLIEIVNKVVVDTKTIADECRQQKKKSKTEIDDVAVTATEIAKSEQLLRELSETGAASARDGDFEELIPEMKIEMKSVKDSLPETEALRRRTHLKNESNLDSVLNVRRPAMSVEPKYGRKSSVRLGAGLNEVVGRAVSVDSGNVGVLPGRTHLRRQRRLNSVDSDEQPEDPIERLNRLRARISGALSEVKGVLKQYSTDVEGDVEKVGTNDVKKEESLPEPSQPKEDEGPVHFRFVKIVRRRSTFNEEDEEEDKEKMVEENREKLEDIKRETSIEDANKYSVVEKSMEDEKKSIDQKKLKHDITKKIAADHQEKPGQKDKVGKEQIKENHMISRTKKPTDATETTSHTTFDAESLAKQEKLETTLQASDKITVLQRDDLKKPLLPDTFHKENSVTEETNETMPEAKADSRSESGTDFSTVKLKKKSLTKTGADRRSSIAAVEGSKIQPPITPTIPLSFKTQRRPSDSEAIVRKKGIVRTTAAGESTAKVKIIHKVKRPSVKRTTAVTATTSETTSTPEVVAKSTSTERAAAPAENSNDSKARANFSSKDTATTAATTLAMQLVIDDASLTIAEPTATEGSSLATKLDEQSHGATVATLLSPLRVSESNGQARDTAEQLAELLGETIIVRPTGELAAIVNNLEVPRRSGNDSAIPRTDRTSSLGDDKTTDCLRVNAKFTAEQVREDQKKNLINHIELLAETSPSNLVKQIEFNTQQQVSKDSETAQPPNRLFEFSTPTADVITTTFATNTTQTTSGEPLAVEATKTITAARTTHSPETTSKSVTSEKPTAAAEMPELQVKAVQVFAEPEVAPPFNVSKDAFGKKKPLLRKVILKNGETTTKKPQANRKITEFPVNEEQLEISIKTETEDKSKNLKESMDSSISGTDHAVPPTINETKDMQAEIADELVATEVTNDEVSIETPVAPEEDILQEDAEEAPAPEKKKRLIKKKVIIKREQHKLSPAIGDSFFKNSAAEEPGTPNEETLEKPVEFVKVDTDEEQDYEEIAKPAQPIKSCLIKREFQVGDEVMYAERYRKTQVRWKRGKVLERITSISYKLEVEGKDVAAHISYIKRYNARKVNFGGKEYLEIDYEQIAEEEEKEERRKARSYSIWNMV